MFEIGWTELMLIGIVALIVIGPKDLPDMFRTMGRFTAKMRSMARDFQRAMDQAAKDSGVNDIAADLKAATSAKSMGLDAVKDAASRFEKWDPLKPAPAVPVKPTVAPAGAVAEVAPTIHAPAARALASATAAKAAVAAKAATASAAPLTHKAKARPRVAKPTEAAVVAKPAPKPRAPRKPAKDA